jgi:hypothetical protein
MPEYSKAETSTRRYRFDQMQRVAVGAVSVPSAEIAEAIEVMLIATTDLFYTVVDLVGTAANPATNAVPLGAGRDFHLQLKPGQFVAAIQATAGGFLYILPVDGRERI